MSTISNELVKDLRMAFSVWQQDYDPVEDKEQYDMFGLGVVAMDELLALRKERERAEPVGYIGRFTADDETLIDQCSPNTKGAFPLYAEPPAPVVPDLERLKEIYSIFCTPTTGSDNALSAIHNACRAAMLNQAQPIAETDTTPQQFESLAGKAVVPAGWKLVPIEPTPDMREAFHQANEEWEDGGATWSPDHQWSAMLAAAPEPCK
ncbi:hypothetical protein ACMSZQ_002764 [Cronobacter dublinensis]